MDLPDFSQQLTKVGALQRFGLCLLRNPRSFVVLNLLLQIFVLWLIWMVSISRRPYGGRIFAKLGGDSALNSFAFNNPRTAVWDGPSIDFELRRDATKAMSEQPKPVLQVFSQGHFFLHRFDTKPLDVVWLHTDLYAGDSRLARGTNRQLGKILSHGRLGAAYSEKMFWFSAFTAFSGVDLIINLGRFRNRQWNLTVQDPKGVLTLNWGQRAVASNFKRFMYEIRP